MSQKAWLVYSKACLQRAETINALQGSEPNEGLSNFYSLNENDYKRDFIEIDATNLSYALSYL